MNRLFSNKGLTLVEIIVTLALMGIIISPIMGFFISSQKINNDSEREYKSIQLAQKYMEEIKSMEKIDIAKYSYNNLYGTYKRSEVEDGYTVNIEISPVQNASNNEDGETIIYDAKLAIGSVNNPNLVYWNNISYQNIIENGDVDLTIESAKIILKDIELQTRATKIKVIFNRDATLNILNSSRDLELYIEKGENINEWKINVEEGKVPKIFHLKEKVATNNILYNIKIDVTAKVGQMTTTVGTKIFN